MKKQLALWRTRQKRARWLVGHIRRQIRSAYYDLYYDRIAPHFKLFMASNNILLWVLALLIGTSVGTLAYLFRSAIGLIQWTWLGTAEEQIGALYQTTPSYLFFLAPVIGGIIVGQILEHCLPGKRAHAVADVIEAKAVKGCHLDLKNGIWSAITAAISLGFGASSGREGPMVHLGAVMSSFIASATNFSTVERRILLATGVAAAVSASFNAPIAGVLFAHEVILAHYALRAFVPVVIASVAATIIIRLTVGEFPAFLIPEYAITSYLEFPAFAILGFVAALVAILFQLSLTTAEHIASNLTIPVWLRPIIGGILIGSIAVFFPEILGVGYDTTDNALKQNLPLILLLGLLVAKTAATAITLASRFGGGIFSPSLYLGACAGGAFGIIAASIFPEIASSNGLYAILGMGGVAAAVLGAPISTTMIVFELTGGYGMTIALLLTVSISTGLTQAVLGMSFFHWQLSRRGLFLFAGPHKQIARTLNVENFYRRVEDMTPLQLNEDGTHPPTLRLSDTIETALRSFDTNGLEELPVVVEKADETPVGIVSQLEALSAYNRALIEAHEEEHH